MTASAKKLRILFLADAVFEDLPGGSRVAARELAEGLKQCGHDITFLVARQSSEPPDDEQRDSIRIIRYGGAGLGAEYVRSGYKACAKLCEKSSFDLVHTHFAYASVGPLRAIPGSVPRIRTFHGPWDEEGWLEDARHKSPVSLLKATVKRRIRYGIEGGSLRRSARVLTLSDCFAKIAKDRYKLDPNRIRVIPGGTNMRRFCLPTDKAEVRKGLGLPNDRRILFTVRRLAPRMGLDNLIKAMPSVLSSHGNVQLLIGGKGPERESLQLLIDTLGLQGHVNLLGFIPDEQLAHYYQAADLFVLPTIALEGFGLVTTEALSCGIPVIGTPVGAIPEILGGLDTSLIASDISPSGLAAAINGFLRGTWNKRLTPEYLRKYVEDHYTWDKHIESVTEVYRSVLPQ